MSNKKLVLDILIKENGGKNENLKQAIKDGYEELKRFADDMDVALNEEFELIRNKVSPVLKGDITKRKLKLRGVELSMAYVDDINVLWLSKGEEFLGSIILVWNFRVTKVRDVNNIEQLKEVLRKLVA